MKWQNRRSSDNVYLTTKENDQYLGRIDTTTRYSDSRVVSINPVDLNLSCGPQFSVRNLDSIFNGKAPNPENEALTAAKQKRCLFLTSYFQNMAEGQGLTVTGEAAGLGMLLRGGGIRAEDPAFAHSIPQPDPPARFVVPVPNFPSPM